VNNVVHEEPGDEQWIVEQVEAVLGADEAAAWLRAPNQHLGGHSPRELLEAGEAARVRAYVTALLDGTFL